MVVSNPWVGYITRSYQQIKASLIQGLVSKAPEITDHSESNILIILISMFSGIAEMLGYYIDNTAREAFIQSARRYSSMVKLTRLVDYRIKAANPSSVDEFILFSAPVPLNGSVPYQLPVLIEVQDSTGIKFVSQNTSPIDIPPGSKSMTLPFIQQVSVLNQVFGSSDGVTLNQRFPILDGYVDSSMTLVIGGVNYRLVETFAFSSPVSLDFTVEVDETGTASIVLGDGLNGLIPTLGSSLVGSYKTTSGASGNLAAQIITTLNTSLSPYLPMGTTVSVTNNNPSTGGTGYEGIEEMRKKAPLSVRTLYRAVTEQDFIDITLQHPGVSKADHNFVCGKTIDIFIVPINGGIAQTGLLNSVLNFLDQYKMVGTFPIIRPAGTTNIVAAIDITLKFRADPVLATASIKAAIKSFFSLQNQNINGAVYKSVFEALIQDIDTTQHLNITKLTTKPYARPEVNPLILSLITQPELNWTPLINPTCLTESNWRVEYLYDAITYPSGKFIIYRNGVFDGDVLPNILYNSPSGDMSMTFNISSVTDYVNTQAWQFTTYIYNADIQLSDFTIPAVSLDSVGNMTDISLNIIQQLVP